MIQLNHLIAIISRKLSGSQTEYIIIELELLSIVETVKEIENILLAYMKVHTDNKNILANELRTRQ